MTFKEWILEQYDHQELKDIANHGCVTGCAHGVIYYHETMALYDKYSEEIWDKLGEESEEFGYKTPMKMIAEFKGIEDVHSDHQFKNLLVWWYIQTIASEKITQGEEE